MQLILHYLKRYKKLFVLNIISVFGFALVELGIPTIVSEMIDNGIMHQDKQYLIRMGIVIVVISLIGVSGTILLGYCCAKISTSVTRDIREDVFQKVQTFSHNEMNQFGIASLITRTNNDAFQIMTFLNVILRTALLTPIMIIVSFTLTIRSSLNLSLIIASTVPVIILGVVIVGKISGPLSDRQQNSLDRINRIFRENLTGIRVIRSFNNDGYESERFDSENSYFMKQSQNLFKLMSSTEPVFFLLMNLAALCIYLTAANMIDAQTLQVGKLVAFMELLEIFTLTVKKSKIWISMLFEVKSDLFRRKHTCFPEQSKKISALENRMPQWMKSFMPQRLPRHMILLWKNHISSRNRSLKEQPMSPAVRNSVCRSPVL